MTNNDYHDFNIMHYLFGASNSCPASVSVEFNVHKFARFLCLTRCSTTTLTSQQHRAGEPNKDVLTMSQGFTVCEHGGRLVYQTQATQQSTRQFLSQNNIRIHPTITIPNQAGDTKKQDDKPAARDSSVVAYASVPSNVLDFARRTIAQLQAYTQSPYDLWRPVTDSHVGPTTSASPIVGFAWHPSKPLLALLDTSHTIWCYSIASSKFLKLQFPFSASTGDELVGICWSSDRDLLVATRSGSLTLVSYNFSTNSTTTQDCSLVSPILQRPSIRFCKWVRDSSRYFLCGGISGTWIYDVYERDATRISSTPALDVTSSDQFIAITTTQHVEIMAFLAPMTLSPVARHKIAVRTPSASTFADSRVLLILSGSIIYALQISRTSKDPAIRPLSSISIGPEMSTSETSTEKSSDAAILCASGSRILASQNGYSVLLYVEIEVNQVVFRKLGSVNGVQPHVLASAQPMHGDRAGTGANDDVEQQSKGGFGCCWSNGTITILPLT